MKNGFSSIKKYGRPKDAAPNTEKEDFRNRVRSDNAIFIFCMEPGSSDYAKKKKVKVTV